MKNKVIVFNGSPRKNMVTDTLCNEIVKAYVDQNPDSEATYVYLNDINFKGCQHCMDCKKTPTSFCSLDDDLTPLLQEFIEADTVIIGSPNYMSDISGQTKLFIDRMYSLKDADSNCKYKDDKKLVFVFAQGATDADYYKKNYDNWKEIFASFKCITVNTLIACSIDRQGIPIIEHPICKEAYNIGKSL